MLKEILIVVIALILGKFTDLIIKNFSKIKDIYKQKKQKLGELNKKLNKIALFYIIVGLIIIFSSVYLIKPLDYSYGPLTNQPTGVTEVCLMDYTCYWTLQPNKVMILSVTLKDKYLMDIDINYRSKNPTSMHYNFYNLHLKDEKNLEQSNSFVNFRIKEKHKVDLYKNKNKTMLEKIGEFIGPSIIRNYYLILSTDNEVDISKIKLSFTPVETTEIRNRLTIGVLFLTGGIIWEFISLRKKEKKVKKEKKKNVKQKK